MNYSLEEIYLMEKDPKLKNLILENQHIKFKKGTKNYYHSMINLVISQFISTSAALSISTNLLKHFEDKYFKDDHFSDLSLVDIQKLGFSINKAKSIKAITEEFLNKRFIHNMTSLSENDFELYLLSIYGVGPWTLNMFKLFTLGEKDIFSSKDAALRKAMNINDMVPLTAKHGEYEDYSMLWKPYRSIACLHLWKSLD